MTLVIYIPFRNGSLLISDRQNTFFQDLTMEPVDKIVILPNFRSVIGFAGRTPQCRHLIDKLRRIGTPSSFEETYREVYQECRGSPELGFLSDDVELLVVTNKPSGKEFVVRKVLGGLMHEVDNKKCWAIGEGAKYVGPQLQIDTRTTSKEEAEEFGLALLRYVSLIDISVGDPTTYGYNVVVIGDQSNSVPVVHPNSVSISKLLYDFDK